MNRKKIIASAVVLSMLLSFAGCDKASEQVQEAADTAAKAFAELDADDIEDVCDETEDDLEDSIDIIKSVDVYDAIIDTITYTVDAESFEGSTKEGEASIDVVYTMVDYEAVFEDDSIESADDLVDALGDSEETKDITVNFEFKLDDDEWLVSNYDDIAEDLYDFLNADIPTFISPDDFESTWFFSDDQNGSYTNTTSIDLELSYIGSDETFTYTDAGIYYTIEQDGSLVYTSEVGEYDAWWSGEGVELVDDMYIPAGEYTITFYANGDVELASGTATVEYEETAAPAAEPAESEGNITMTTEGEDFYTVEWYSDEERTQVCNDYTTDSIGFIFKIRTWAYYGTDATMTCTVTCNGEELYTETYENPEDGNDTAYFAYIPGETIDGGDYTVTVTGYDGDVLAVFDIDVAV